jgi:hypothetical protein
MVYFGERRFRGARQGNTPRERVRLRLAVLLLGVLLLVFYMGRWYESEPEGPIGFPVTPRAEAPRPPRDAAPAVAVRSAIGDPVEIPDYEPNGEPAPFDTAAPTPLAAVRDDEIAAPGEPEVAGLIWLFHRFRAGPEIPYATSIVPWEELPARKSEMRGLRRSLQFQLIEEPIPRSLPENPSGVRRYWEAFGVDPEGHMLRIDFIDKPRILPADSQVVADADFLRLYRYQMLSGGEGVVPEWVAGEVRLIAPAPGTESSWQPLYWVAGITLILLVPIIRAMTRTPAGRPLRRSRPGDAAAPPPEAS